MRAAAPTAVGTAAPSTGASPHPRTLTLKSRMIAKKLRMIAGKLLGIPEKFSENFGKTPCVFKKFSDDFLKRPAARQTRLGRALTFSRQIHYQSAAFRVPYRFLRNLQPEEAALPVLFHEATA